MARYTQTTWGEVIDRANAEIKDMEARRNQLLRLRQDLIVLGLDEGWTTKLGLSVRLGLSRGRIQQIVNARKYAEREVI